MRSDEGSPGRLQRFGPNTNGGEALQHEEWRNETAAILVGLIPFGGAQLSRISGTKPGPAQKSPKEKGPKIWPKNPRRRVGPRRVIGPARMVPSHDGMPDPRGPGTHPGLVCPTSGPAMGGGRGTRIQTPLTRSLRGDRGVSTQRTDVPTRVRGATGDSPITHIRRRLAACAWKRGEAGLTRQRRVWVGRHMRSMCVTAGWGSHRHEECGVLNVNT